MSKGYKQLLNDVCEDCKQDYCILKDLLLTAHTFDERFLVQLKCVEIYKYEESKTEDKDIGWSDAFMQWADKGFAKKFADLYDEDSELTPRQLYNKIIAK